MQKYHLWTKYLLVGENKQNECLMNLLKAFYIMLSSYSTRTTSTLVVSVLCSDVLCF